MNLGELIGQCQKFVNKHDDDLVDRYNHRVTVIFLGIFIAVIATKQYYGEPIIWYIDDLSGLFLFIVLDCNCVLICYLVGLQLISQERIILMRILFGNDSLLRFL